jgi:hypothetical protein
MNLIMWFLLFGLITVSGAAAGRLSRRPSLAREVVTVLRPSSHHLK